MKQKDWEIVCWAACLFAVSVVPAELLALTIPIYSSLWWSVLAVNAVALPIVIVCFAMEMKKRNKEKTENKETEKEHD